MKAAQNKQQYWRDHVSGAEKFPGSHEEYCRMEGISSPALRYWRKKAAGERRHGRSAAVESFIPVEVMSAAAPHTSLPDPRWLAELIFHLNGGVR